MNAAAKNVHQGQALSQPRRAVALTREVLGLSLLVMIMLASAISVIYVKNYERQLFSQYEYSQRDAQKMHVEWGQLLLEESTWATPARVQALAKRHFGMQVPKPGNSFMVRM